jgi:iron complex outermembrane receptor protein
LFVAGVPNEVGTFANNSRLAQLLSIPGLKEETSNNYSLGFTAKVPSAGLKFTVDGYIVNVDDRVTQTRSYGAPADDDGNGVANNPADQETLDIFNDAGAGQAKFFMNAYNLESSGIDIVVDHKMGVGEGTLNNSLAASFRKFEVKDVVEVLGEEVLDDTAIGFIESAMPRTKVNLTNSYKVGDWNFLLRNVYFGEVDDPDFQGAVTYDAKVVTDLSASYAFNDNLSLTLGANNLLDVYPDEVPTASNYGDQFIFSRRTSQFGFNGRYVFGRITFKLK